jgi:glycosyltransferase 2 family protein
MTDARPPARATDPRRARRSRLVRIAVGITLLAVLLWRTDLGQLSVRWSWQVAAGAAACAALLATAQGLSALRWRILLGAGAPPWTFLYRLYLVAAFFSLFLPTAVGGDAVRAAAATRSLGRPGEMIGTVLLDRALGVLALLAFFAAGLGLDGVPGGLGLDLGTVGRWAPAAAAALALAGLAAFLLRRRLARPLAFLGTVGRTAADLARSPGRLGAAVATGVLVQAAYVLAWLAVAGALDLGVPAAAYLVMVPLVSLGTMAPITLSGVGVREGAWILLLAPWGVPAANALALSLVYFGCWMLVAGAGGVLFAWRGTGAPAVSGTATPGP